MADLIGNYVRLGPDVTAEGWDATYSSPYVTQAPRVPYTPWLLRGRHEYAVQPRDISPMSRLPADPMRTGVEELNLQQASSIVESASPYAWGAVDPQAETKTSTYLFLGGLGALLLYVLAKRK